MLQGQSHALVQCTACVAKTIGLIAIGERLLTHAHGCIAVTILHAHLLLSQLGRCDVVARADKLLISLPTRHVPLDGIVVNLAQSLTLLRLEFLAVIGARFSALLVAAVDLDGLADLGRRVARDVERVQEVVEHLSVLQVTLLLLVRGASRHVRGHVYSF